MKNKKILLIFGILLVCLFVVSAMELDFYYSPNCKYCEQITPIVFLFTNHFGVEVNSYNVLEVVEYAGPVPKFIITTDDNRKVTFIGADAHKLFCELQEMTTKECQTYRADTSIGNNESWFIK